MYTEDDLEILIATMNRTDLSFLESMFNTPLDLIKANLFIVNQSKSGSISSSFLNIKVWNTNDVGLSRSRNLAIQKSTKKLLWILDDDCEVVSDSVANILQAHNSYSEYLITFQTKRKKDDLLFYNYPPVSQNLSSEGLKKVLSPEITIKREALISSTLRFDLRFGLGAQFQDSENYVFLMDALELGLKTRFFPSSIVKHKSTTSSDEASSDRVIYARGALAARKGIFKATYFNFKYTFFLWRKGFVKSAATLWKKHKVFERGVNDYLWGFENR
jgi:GT2 family glycosyltransferase